MKIIKIYIVAFLVLFSGCSAKRKSTYKLDSVVTAVNTINAKINATAVTNLKKITHQQKTDSGSIIVEIIPEGEFTYTLQNGYKGRAKSLKTTSTGKSTTTKKDSTERTQTTQTTADLNANSNQEARVKKTTKDVKVTGANFGNSIAIAIAVVLIAVVLIYVKR